MKRFTILDFYRFVAAFGVVLFHINQFSPGNHVFLSITSDFDLFVDFFFVLSGFVIGFGYAHKVGRADEIGIFLRRRVARIYPLYLVTTLCFVALYVLGISSHPERYTGTAILSQVLMVRQWQLNPPLPFNFPAWSISAEWAMYLLFPVLMFAVRRTGLITLFCVSTISAIAIEVLAVEGIVHVPLWSAVRAVPTFAVGVFISQLNLNFRLKHGELMGLLAFTSAIAAMIAHIAALAVISLFCVSILLTSLRETAEPRFGSPLLELLGNCSYSVYLLHAIAFTIFYTGLWPHLHAGPVPLTVSIVVAIAVIPLAGFSFYLFETPARRLIAGSRTHTTQGSPVPPTGLGSPVPPPPPSIMRALQSDLRP